MMPFDAAITYMVKMSQSNSDTAATFLKLMYNVGYKIILTEFGRQVTEKEAPLTLTAGVRRQVVPVDCKFPKTLELIDGTTIDPVTEVTSDRDWTLLKSGNVRGRPEAYHYKPTFGVGGGIIELYPIPSSSSYILNLIYEAGDKDLSQLQYTTGTITLTLNSATVTGSGTTFTAAMAGRYLIPPDGMPYRILSYTSATSITLEQAYTSATTAGLAFKIVEIPNLPDDMQIIPCYFSLEAWWSGQGNAVKQKEFKDNWVIAMARAKKTHATVTRNNIVNQEMPASPFPGNPSYFPNTITE